MVALTGRAKPRIAMTTWRRTMPTFLSERTDLYTLGAEYPAAVLAAGGLPYLLPHHHAEDAQSVLKGFDGVVLVGGDDVDPAQYGQPDHGCSKGVSPTADESDIALARAAVDLELPTFAICRGCQVLNVAMGGTLFQDVTAGGTHHEPISPVPDEVLGARHPLRIAAGSRLAKAYGNTEHVVNNIHHQAIDQVAPRFRAVAWAPDGVIEAIEPDDPELAVLAVQWHPEKIVNEGDHVLFEHFVKEMIG
ncbi:MAG: gamma-glutamyl-gamma-aminobutyrate hydrolase family protein [Ilumatobacteraceae bacterium]|nr:MAG: gamma-glutamyl-gamma-aminobutyrate hydrolase family protein [Actinomycetota bacterium]